MFNYVLSSQAESDVDRIASYTVENFGIAQAKYYIEGLHQSILTLTEYPLMGSDQSHIKPKARRIVYRSHAIYYVLTEDVVFVLRILGPGEDPLRQIN